MKTDILTIVQLSKQQNMVNMRLFLNRQNIIFPSLISFVRNIVFSALYANFELNDYKKGLAS